METVEKTLDLLEVFLKQEGEVGLAEIATQSGLNISSAYRIASSLVQRRYLRQKQKRGKYSLGIKMLEFNSAVQKTLKIGDIALPYLIQLSKESGEYSEVAILDKDCAVTVAQAEVDNNLRIKNTVGERLPLYPTSIGKIMLAFLPEAERHAYYANHTLTPFTEKTVTDPSRMELELKRISKQGFAVDNQEYGHSIWSVAAPILDFNRRLVGGLAIAAPSYRADPAKARTLAALVRRYAGAISTELGFQDQNDSSLEGGLR